MINQNFNGTVLLLNMLDDCHMRQHREWGTMAAVGRRRPAWSFVQFFLALASIFLAKTHIATALQKIIIARWPVHQC